MKKMSAFLTVAALLTALVLGAGPAQAAITINNGEPFTAKAAVTLHLDFAPVPAKMQFSFNGAPFKPAVPFVATKNVTLPAGDGQKTVAVKFLDANNNVLNPLDLPASVILDTKAPVATVAINKKALFTNNRTVALDITAVEKGSGVKDVCIREDAVKCLDAEFVPFAATMNHDIASPGDGRKMLHVTLRDNANRTSIPKMATITLDTVPPTGSIVSINAGKAESGKPRVPLKLAAVKSSHMLFSFDGGLSFDPQLVKFAPNTLVDLPPGSGKRSVTVKFRDLAGNESAPASSASITLLPPAGNIATASQGVITGFGSVFVNGVEFDIAPHTIIKIDDIPATALELKEGMVVKVKGAAKNDATRKGISGEIEARDALEGEIESVDPVAKTITVMGQTIKVEDNVTRLNDDNLQKVFGDANFLVTDHVEVHGFADDLGGVRATRIAKKAANLEFEAKGFVVSVAGTLINLAPTKGGASFITVDTVNVGLPAGVAVDSFVEVKSAAAPVAGAVTATFIQLEDRLGDAGVKIEVEGIVTIGTLADFMVNGTRVVTDVNTLFEGGLATDFAVGAKLEAEGPVDASGTITATKISFESSVKIEGDVTAADAIGGTLTVLGKAIASNQFTRIDSGIFPIIGDHVEVRAGLDRNGGILATRIIAQNPSNKAFIQGKVASFSAATGTMSILGIPVTSDATTQWRASSTLAELPVLKADFFSKLTADVTVVKARFASNAPADLAGPIKEAEIEIGK